MIKNKAEGLLTKLNDKYKNDANEDMPIPTSTTGIYIREPRFPKNEAYKKEYKKEEINY